MESQVCDLPLVVWVFLALGEMALHLALQGVSSAEVLLKGGALGWYQRLIHL